MPKTTIYRVRLSDAWSCSILEEGKRPVYKEKDETVFIQSEADEAGREISRVKHGDDGAPLETKRTEYGTDGGVSLAREYFAESGAEVLHEFSREPLEGGRTKETERVLYGDELDSIVERDYRADGSLEAERKFDAAGEEMESIAFDEEGRPRPAEGEEVSEERLERRQEGAVTEEIVSDASGGLVSRILVERDERGRIIRNDSESGGRGGRYFTRALYSYDEGAAAPSLLRIERWIDYGPDQQRRILPPGFRMAVYDAKGRPAELLYADYHEGDFEPDSYYRFEYVD